MDRIIPGLGVESEVQRIENDRLCAEVETLLRKITTGPWIPDVMANIGKNWLVADFGRDENTIGHIVTTDSIRASQLSGDPESDAKFIALARTLLPLLIEERKTK